MFLFMCSSVKVVYTQNKNLVEGGQMGIKNGYQLDS